MRRVLVLSHTYLQPAHRGKLRALAARGLEVTVAIPQRWREPWFGRPIDVAWERQGGLEVFPLPARGTTKYSGSALKAHRGKLRALAARGLEVTVAIPQRWREPWFGRPIDVAWERQGGLEVFPLPARGTTKYSGSALK